MKNIIKAILICTLLLIACTTSEDNESPDVQITEPLNGALVFGTVNIVINATDNEEVKTVELYINDSLVATFVATPYTYAWVTDSLPDSSSWRIYAKAYDTAENEGISDTINVTVYSGSPANVLIWLYDSNDIFSDAEIGDTIDCAYWLKKTLMANGYTYTCATYLPDTLNDYDIVLVTLGWYRC